MQFDDFDKRIREAADHHHPSYEEKAWTKMEKQLDKHMPTGKDDRRRIIFLLLLFVLLGGGAWLFIDKPWKQSSTQISGVSESAGKQGNSDNKNLNSATGNSPATNNAVPGESVSQNTNSIPANSGDGSSVGSGNVAGTSKDNTISQTQSPSGKSQDNEFSIATNSPSRGKRSKPADTKTTVSKDQASFTQDKKRENGNIAKSNADVPKDNTVGNNPIAVPPAAVDTKDISTVKEPVPAATDSKNQELAKTKTDSVPAAKVKPAKKKKGSENGLAFSFSAGPDISAIGFDNAGKTQLVYGAGLSYTFAHKFVVRSGFYVARKIYSASPSDYKPKNPLPNPNYLIAIDADCKVYEIPVNIAWNFLQKKNHSWFGAAGLSSYIMKEEKYDYIYKWPGGQPTPYTYTFNNENKHLFSVLSISGGYTRRFGKLSLSAEPYMKLPLSGIGHGNVQLNSFGILFTVGTKLTNK
jgi:hypothetical protein